MTVLIHPTYFPSIAHVVAMIKADKLIFEACDNYQKQTYRNRTTIYSANGRLNLNIPVHYTQKKRQLYKDVEISNVDNWQDLHLKSLESAYSASPFFEFYIDELEPLFTTEVNNLMDFNYRCLDIVFECLQHPLHYQKTKSFQKTLSNCSDARVLVNCRKEMQQDFTPYDQVFDDKHGFIQNLSILDLLFNEGPNTLLYLLAQTLKV